MYKKKNLEGQKFGKLTVIKSIGYYRPNDRHFWSLVKCDCGNTFNIQDTLLVSGRRTQCPSCGRQANATHNMTKSRIYHVYQSMKGRCYNPNNTDYKSYGGRGIKVCEEWVNDPCAFIEWAYKTGYDENAEYMECTLDRINVNEDYSPDNCRWVDKYVQALNKTDTIYMLYQGKKLPLQTVSKLSGIKAGTLLYRISHGYSDEDAVNLPIGCEEVRRKSRNNQLKRRVILTNKITLEQLKFESCTSASRFLGHNDGYLSTKFLRLKKSNFEIEDYYVEIGEHYN